MALNVFFFSDESMHNIYVSGGEFNFFDHVTQMFLTTLVSQLLSVFLNFLTITDIHYYNIKSMALNELNKKKIVSVMKLIKCKIIVYYIFTFILFFFDWYTITAFCAVYRNTQNIFIIDSISSFIMGLIYPFVLYIFPAGLRLLSLMATEKKNLECLYSLSDIIPFF